MKHGRPGKRLPYAVIAQVIVAEHRIAGADKPEIVQRLYYGSAFITRGAIDRRRHHGKSIVEVRHFNPVVANKKLNRFCRLRIPYRVPGELQLSGTFDRIVVKLVSDHFVATIYEQVRLRGKHLVFRAGLLVTVMGNEYPH
jgi:hypothetical protein